MTYKTYRTAAAPQWVHGDEDHSRPEFFDKEFQEMIPKELLVKVSPELLTENHPEDGEEGHVSSQEKISSGNNGDPEVSRRARVIQEFHSAEGNEPK